MTDGRTRRLFVEMLREEWRLHDHLFRGRRFELFPLVVAALVAGAAALLVATGTTPDAVVAGLHALAFVFGLHTGSIGFVGRDALRNLLGDVTLLVFSARTLPLSRPRVLAVFVVKDVVYYAGLFLLPIAVGATPAVLGGPVEAVGPAAGTVLLLWATLTLSFVLGLGTTISAIGLARRGIPGLAVLAAVAAGVGLAWAGGVDLAAYTPYGAFRTPTLPRFGASLAVLGAVFAVAAAAFDATGRRPARTAGPAFRRWLDRIGDPLATRTLLDVHRSSGGFGKVVFSAAVLFGVTAGLVDLAGRITGVAPSVGVSFGAVLGLSGFTTYNWLTQADGVDAYLVHPVTTADVLDAKFRAFLLLGPLVGLGFYAAALAWRGGPLLEALVGAVLLVGVACHVFGTTVYLAGLSPDEFLFDGALFAVFGAATAVPLVPVLVAGFALAPLSAGLLAALGLGGCCLAVVGVGLYRRARPKWTARYRTGA
ncbi:hypothetical protein [Halomicrobium salinisoli]|uniref:hypothetical protein n=1 Tax=Halomicrobium salinisoli TaxID=2878391 RepID=UPI001CF01C29|nr:hypothetical protein [Halomicrobium salinisoli]